MTDNPNRCQDCWSSLPPAVDFCPHCGRSLAPKTGRRWRGKPDEGATPPSAQAPAPPAPAYTPYEPYVPPDPPDPPYEPYVPPDPPDPPAYTPYEPYVPPPSPAPATDALASYPPPAPAPAYTLYQGEGPPSASAAPSPPAPGAVAVLERDPAEFPGQALPPDFFAAVPERTRRAPRKLNLRVLLVVAVAGSGAIINALAAAGLLFLVKQQLRFPAGHQPVEEVASLLERLDAGPMAGIPVEVKGRIIGRGFPGYRLSPDLVVQDDSGFVPLAYRQPVPFLAELFGLFRAEKFMGQEVVARGWYRRAPGPMIELQRVVAADGRQARSWTYIARYCGSVALLAVGLITALAGLSA